MQEDIKAAVGKHRGPKLREPKDNETLNLLWRIMGSHEMSLRGSAAKLKMDEQVLGHLLRGRVKLIGRMMKKYGMQESLAHEFPDAWEAHKDRLAELLLEETKRKERYARPRAAQNRRVPLYRDWHAAAGAFVKNTLAEKGDAVEDILPHVARPFLKDREIWTGVMAGDKKIAPPYFISAAEEICALYRFDNSTPAGRSALLMTNALKQEYKKVMREYTARAPAADETGAARYRMALEWRRKNGACPY